MKKIIGLLIFVAIIGFGIWYLIPSRNTGWLGTNRPLPVADATSTAPIAFTATSTVQSINSDKNGIAIDIQYPAFSFTGVSDAAAQSISASVASDTAEFQAGFLSDVASYRESSADSLPAGADDSYGLTRRYVIAPSGLFGTVSVLYLDLRGYAGAAHPENSFSSRVYDLSDGSVITPEKIAADGSLPQLYAQFIAALAAKYNIDPSTDYNLTADRLPEFAHFIVEDAGLHMYVDQDAILSHAEGSADVSLPWSGLKDVVSARFISNSN